MSTTIRIAGQATGRALSRIMGALLLISAMFLGACDGDRDVDLPDVNLDSAGSKIERGMEKAGEKLDTAISGLKTEFNEAQVRGTIRKMQGMDDVDVELRPDGHVRLHGSVPSDRERELAGEVARNIKGVTGVTNELVIGAADTTSRDTVRSDTAVLEKKR